MKTIANIKIELIKLEKKKLKLEIQKLKYEVQRLKSLDCSK